jgi:hypothetical protein
MKLTEENKQYIDSLSYESLLSHWRFASLGDPWFQDETGDYWNKKMRELREQGARSCKRIEKYWVVNYVLK